MKDKKFLTVKTHLFRKNKKKIFNIQLKILISEKFLRSVIENKIANNCQIIDIMT